ncbi:MAG: AraC family transcriptional regulator, partial [Bacteroidota bacterium]
EKGTTYPLLDGKLSVYETNCVCRDIKFYFEHYVLTLMVSGHKTVEGAAYKIEFFPGTLFIPERKQVQTVSIPNASFDNPTKCLVLEVNPAFLQSFYEELSFDDLGKQIFTPNRHVIEQDYFVSNSQRMVDTFIRLYENRLQENTPGNQLITRLIMKELFLLVMQSPAAYLIRDNFEEKVAQKDIQKSIEFIRQNLQHKISVEQLASVSGLGLTTFFKRFKHATESSPADFILKERIRQSKILILKNQLNLKEIAYECGFNSYEYFCTSFKKIEQLKPTEFRSMRLMNEMRAG